MRNGPGSGRPGPSSSGALLPYRYLPTLVQRQLEGLASTVVGGAARMKHPASRRDPVGLLSLIPRKCSRYTGEVRGSSTCQVRRVRSVDGFSDTRTEVTVETWPLGKPSGLLQIFMWFAELLRRPAAAA